MHLEVRGEGVVTAADIITSPEVQIINPDLYLFTADNSKTRLDIELIVERGRGYAPSNERGRMPIGELPVDAIFSPVKRVNWEVLAARVGTTRSRINFFMNKFRKLGFIKYNGTLEVHSSLLSVVTT